MSIQEILTCGGGALVVLLTLIQIAPIKVNPWSALANAIGKALNKEVLTEIASLRKEVADLKQDVKAVDEAEEENRIIACRTRILRFGDEVVHKVKHSKEHFDQIMQDMTDYEKYCREHAEFQNDKTVETSARIKAVYQKCLENGDFL